MRGSGLARVRQSVSPIRHDGPFRAFGLHLGPAVFAPPQPPGWAHLVSLRAGAATLRTDRHVAHVSANVAVWLPLGTPYALELHGPCSLRVGYVAPEFAPLRAFGSVTMTPLLREILERAITSGYLDPGEPRDARLLAVARDELHALEDAGEAFVLPLPHDPNLLRAVRSMLDDRDALPSVALLGSLAAMSTRTFQRQFLNETGLTPRDWVRRLRLRTAITSLAHGASVTEAGFAAGYSSTSAFVSGYRDAFGITPGAMWRPLDCGAKRIL